MRLPTASRGNADRHAAALVAAVTGVVLVLTFLFMHTGARGESLCSESGLGSGGPAPSLLPPGAPCIGASDAGQVVKLDPSFLLVGVAAYLLMGLVTWVARPGRRGKWRPHPLRRG